MPHQKTPDIEQNHLGARRLMHRADSSHFGSSGLRPLRQFGANAATVSDRRRINGRLARDRCPSAPILPALMQRSALHRRSGLLSACSMAPIEPIRDRLGRRMPTIVLRPWPRASCPTTGRRSGSMGIQAPPRNFTRRHTHYKKMRLPGEARIEKLANDCSRGAYCRILCGGTRWRRRDRKGSDHCRRSPGPGRSGDRARARRGKMSRQRASVSRVSGM